MIRIFANEIVEQLRGLIGAMCPAGDLSETSGRFRIGRPKLRGEAICLLGFTGGVVGSQKIRLGHGHVRIGLEGLG